MGQTSELLTHTEALLSAQAWAAALHVRQGAQRLSSRTEALRWRRLTERVPPGEKGKGIWPHALMWVAYRTEDQALLSRILAEHSGQYPAFEAFLASLSDQ